MPPAPEPLPVLSEAPGEKTSAGLLRLTSPRSSQSGGRGSWRQPLRRPSFGKAADEQSQQWQRWSMHSQHLHRGHSHSDLCDISPSNRSTQSSCRKEATRILHTPWFDTALGFVIIVNALAMGVEQQLEMDGWDTSPLKLLDNIFLVIYILELGLRVYAGGLESLREAWIRFDFVLVATGVMTNWVLQPLIGGLDAGWPIMVLKAARLLRLARVVRLLMKFPELWVLLRGLVESGKTMFYTLMLLTLVIYVFSSIGTELIIDNELVNGPDVDEDTKAVVEKYFHSLPGTMLTLIQFVSLDNMVMVYRPLVEKDIKLFIFFVTLILVVSIVLMNLVTAVIVNCAIEQASQDKALKAQREIQERKRLVKSLRQIFLRLDEDGSGDISWDEFGNISDADLQVLSEALHASDVRDIFRALDVDDSGSIGIEEFCEGIWKVMVSKTPIEMKRIEAHVVAIRKTLREVEAAQAATQELGALLRTLGKLSSEAVGEDSALQLVARRHEAPPRPDIMDLERIAAAARLPEGLPPALMLIHGFVAPEEADTGISKHAIDSGVSHGGLECQPLRKPLADDGLEATGGLFALRPGASITAVKARRRAGGGSPARSNERLGRAQIADDDIALALHMSRETSDNLIRFDVHI